MTLNNALTTRILLFMLAGIVFGFLIKTLSASGIEFSGLNDFLVAGGDLFLSLMQLLVVPVVFVSMVDGVCSIDRFQLVSKAGSELLKWFIITTICASLLAIFVAHFFNVGIVLPLGGATATIGLQSFWQFVGSIIPRNPIEAIAHANMMQIAVFALLFGFVVNASGEHGKRVAAFFADLKVVAIKAVSLFMFVVPFGIFCLMSVLFASKGVDLVLGMLEYFIMVLLALSLHVVFTLSIIMFLSQLSPKVFFKKVYSLMLFAFGVSSSNVSIPVTLDTVENKLGVSKSMASLIVPFGSVINKNGTAIMQVVATIFIANVYNVPINSTGYVSLILMVMLMSIGTSGAPGFGLITLIMVLKQMGLPIEGIVLVIGVDRLLDMVRTSVNVTGNATVACLIGNSSKQLDHNIYHGFN